MTLQEFLAKGAVLLGLAEKGLPDQAAIKAQIDALQGNVSARDTKIGELESRVAELTSKLSASEESVVNLKAEAAKAQAAIEAAKAETEAAKKSVDAAASQKAAAIAAGQGVPAIKIKGGTSAPEETLKRAEFESMSARDRAVFIRSGGKLMD